MVRHASDSTGILSRARYHRDVSIDNMYFLVTYGGMTGTQLDIYNANCKGDFSHRVDLVFCCMYCVVMLLQLVAFTQGLLYRLKFWPNHQPRPTVSDKPSENTHELVYYALSSWRTIRSMIVLHALSALMYVYVADDVEFVGSLALEELLTHLQVTTRSFTSSNVRTCRLQ